MLLVDAQTSGGILMAVDPEVLPTLLARLREEIPGAAIIGELTEGPPGRIQVF
jgi:selenophosphate synthase